MSSAPLHVSESMRVKLPWTILGLTVVAWIAAMAIRISRPVISAVMDPSEQAIDGAYAVHSLLWLSSPGAGA